MQFKKRYHWSKILEIVPWLQQNGMVWLNFYLWFSKSYNCEKCSHGNSQTGSSNKYLLFYCIVPVMVCSWLSRILAGRAKHYNQTQRTVNVSSSPTLFSFYKFLIYGHTLNCFFIDSIDLIHFWRIYRGPQIVWILWSLGIVLLQNSTKRGVVLNIRCGHVVRDFESEAKTR